jgi:phosphosulfolactate synthase (CoM biosynthesis protein A)
VRISTGGFIEHVWPLGPDSVYRYTGECHELRFDIVEISSGFITIPTDDWLRLIEQVQRQEMKAKPQVGIQFGAGGATAAAELAAEGMRDPQWAIEQARPLRACACGGDGAARVLKFLFLLQERGIFD